MKTIEIMTKIVGIQNINKLLHDIKLAEIKGKIIDDKYLIPDIEFQNECNKRQLRLNEDIKHIKNDFRTNLARWENER